MKIYSSVIIIFLSLLFGFCSDPPLTIVAENAAPLESAKSYKYLALGDSYTIGQSVCDSCNFPQQLQTKIRQNLDSAFVDLNIIAKTGWTTTNLKSAIDTENPSYNYDLVTLLIGVNNQYQSKPFSLYESEFPELLSKAILCANGDKNNVIVISIPDYAFTPYGSNRPNGAIISAQIDQYNTFARNYCAQQNIAFVNITDITQQGLVEPSLVASDGLHPSEIAYSKFVERLLPKALEILNRK